MAERAGSQNLTGVWAGTYAYPGGQAVGFTATLIQSSSFLSGTTHEPCILGGAPTDVLFATLEGGVQGREVSFVKRYDGSNPYYSAAVHYAGRLNSAATRIEGHWRISWLSRGRFVMTREAGAEEGVERETEAVA